MPNTNENGKIVISYLKLRRVVGVLGFALPFLLVIGSVLVGDCKEIQSSLSSYYHTIMRDLFVGVLCVVAFFLFAYNGHETKDKIATDLACLFALGIAFFPTSMVSPESPCAILSSYVNNTPVNFHANPLTRNLHYLFAGCFFLILSFISLFLFTKTDGRKTKEKIKRNRIYRVCGVIMILCILVLPICLLTSYLAKYRPLFVLESIALFAFGISWLTKGELFLKDKSLPIEQE